MQVQGALDHLDEIDSALAGGRGTREVSEVLHDFRGAARLLLQHRQLLAGSFVGLGILQEFAHAHDAG